MKLLNGNVVAVSDEVVEELTVLRNLSRLFLLHARINCKNFNIDTGCRRCAQKKDCKVYEYHEKLKALDNTD